MSKNLTRKILENHLIEGELVPGQEIAIKIDHTLLQDATGTVAMLEFEALGLDSVKAELCAQYVDHNIIQGDNKNADDHKYLQTACARYGVNFSPPGNGISHQVHMERFGVPGKIILGADSHTPGAAGVSMMGIGAGGMDVAMAMAGRPYRLPCPKVLGVKLTGSLPDWVSAKDVILEMLRRYDVKGCVGKIVEYYGPGVSSLSATDRETVGNMGTELGATSTVFPSDENTLRYLKSQRREGVWIELLADENAEYDEYDEIDLCSLEPLIACPSSPGNVVPVREVAGLKVDQVIIGSSVNSSFRDLMVVARTVEGRKRNIDTDFNINPGSRQVLENIGDIGGLTSLIMAGARIHESGCLGCIGMGQAPGTGQVSLRTFPRNFPGRSGTKDDRVYLCSPETAAAAVLRGVITDPRDLSPEISYPVIKDPLEYIVDEDSIIIPKQESGSTKVIRGPNIKPLPHMERLPETLEAEVVIKVGDNISTDGIMPAGSKILPLRSNIEALSEFVFSQIDPDFYKTCKKKGNVAVIGGENYGQGSSREHAALAPRYLGVRVKIAKSFARIHKANLCNFGILPLVFKNPADYEMLENGSTIVLEDIRNLIKGDQKEIPVRCKSETFITILDVSERQRKYLLAGGALNYVKEKIGNNMAGFREEQDSMGTVSVPENAYYGAQTKRAGDNFKLSSLRFNPVLYRALGFIKKHAAITNRDLKLIESPVAEAIIEASEQVIKGKFNDHFIVDVFQTGSGTSTNMNANEVIAGRANEIITGKRGGKFPVHPNDHVNKGQSSNDVIPSAIHIASAIEIRKTLIPAMKRLFLLLDEKAQKLKDVKKIARTHLQDAVPVSLGQEFSGYCRQVRLNINRLDSVQGRLCELPLGGTAVGTGVNTHHKFAANVIKGISEETDIDFIEAVNHFEAQASRDTLVELSGILKTYAVSLTKIANDIRWLSSGPRCGLGEINIPDLQPGSSIMPGKVNPVIPEAVLQVAAQVIGNDAAIAVCGQSGNFELNVMMPLMAYNVMQSIELLSNASMAFADKCIKGITANIEKCESNIEKSLSMATALVAETGYDKAAEIAKQAYKEGKTVRETVKEHKIISSEKADNLLDKMIRDS